MRTFFMHIGMNKTGSTAIQNYFGRNHEYMRAMGLHYPRFTKANHTHFFKTLLRPGRSSSGSHLSSSQERKRLDESDRLGRDFKTFIGEAAAEDASVLLSGEGGSLLTAEELRTIRDLVRPEFDRIVVLGLVRPPMAFARSVMQQRIQGMGRTVDSFLERPPVPEYQRRFAPHLEVFGRENVRLGIYEPSLLKDGCVLQTLFSMMELDDPSLGGERADRRNTSISLTAAKVFSLFNRAALEGPTGEDAPAEVRRFVDRRLWSKMRGRRPKGWPVPLRKAITNIDGPRFVLPLDVAERVRAASAPDVEWMSSVLSTNLHDHDKRAEVGPYCAAYSDFSPEEAERIRSVLGRIGGHRNRRGSPGSAAT